MDTTSLYFEGAGGQTLGRHGYSKDHRPDLRQMIVAVLIDGDGHPVCSDMWPGNTFNYPQFRPLRWLPIPDPSNEIAPSTSRHCLELDLLPDSDNHLVLRSSSGSAQVFWLEAAFCSCLSQNGQATLSQDRSMQFSETRSESLGSSSSTRKPASSGCRTPISGSQDAPQFEASTLLRDNLTLVSCGTFQFSTSWRTNRAFQRRPESIGQANR